MLIFSEKLNVIFFKVPCPNNSHSTLWEEQVTWLFGFKHKSLHLLFWTIHFLFKNRNNRIVISDIVASHLFSEICHSCKLFLPSIKVPWHCSISCLLCSFFVLVQCFCIIWSSYNLVWAALRVYCVHSLCFGPVFLHHIKFL